MNAVGTGPAVLHICTSVDSGGAGRTALMLAQAQNRAGAARARVLAGRGGSPAAAATGDPAAGIVDRLGVSRPRFLANVLAYRLTGVEAPFNHAHWRRVRPLIDGVDLLHLHNAHGYYLPLPVLDRLLARPCVWTLHDWWLPNGGHCARADAGQPGRAYPLELVDRSAGRRARLLDMVARHRPLLLCPTETMRAELAAAGLPADLLHAVPHGLFDSPDPAPGPTRAEARQLLGWPAGPFTCLFVAERLDDPLKGFDLLCAAMARLPAGLDLRCAVVGGGRPARWRGDPRISLLGPLPRARMPLALAAADLLVSASRSESFGLVVAEALGQGTPVLCPDLPVLREVAGPAGRTFPPGDAAALADALAAALSAGLVDPLSLARGVRARLQIGNWVDRHAALYRRVLHK